MKLTLIDKLQEVENVYSFYFEAETNINWQAGQFMRYHIEDPRPDERRLDRYFTISSAPSEKNIRLTTRFTPNKSSTFKIDLANLEVGQAIEASGPLGSFIVEDPQGPYLFIAGGIGITPFRSILLDLDHKKKPLNITLLYANRDQNIVFKSELDDLAKKHPEFKLHLVIDPERIDVNKISQFVPNLNDSTIYISGPKPMVEGIEKILKDELGVSEDKIITDYFPGYKEI